MAQTGGESLLTRLREKDDEISELKQSIQKLQDEIVSAHSCLGTYNDELIRLVAETSSLETSLATRFLSTRP